MTESESLANCFKSAFFASEDSSVKRSRSMTWAFTIARIYAASKALPVSFVSLSISACCSSFGLSGIVRLSLVAIALRLSLILE